MPKGGARPGAGRPVQGDEPTKMHSLRSTESDWQLILAFAKVLKYGDKNAAKDFIKQTSINLEKVLTY